MLLTLGIHPCTLLKLRSPPAPYSGWQLSCIGVLSTLLSRCIHARIGSSFMIQFLIRCMSAQRCTSAPAICSSYLAAQGCTVHKSPQSWTHANSCAYVLCPLIHLYVQCAIVHKCTVRDCAHCKFLPI